MAVFKCDEIVWLVLKGGLFCILGMTFFFFFHVFMFNHHCFTNISNDTSALGVHLWQLEIKTLTFLSGMIFQSFSSEMY